MDKLYFYIKGTLNGSNVDMVVPISKTVKVTDDSGFIFKKRKDKAILTTINPTPEIKIIGDIFKE